MDSTSRISDLAVSSARVASNFAFSNPIFDPGFGVEICTKNCCQLVVPLVSSNLAEAVSSWQEGDTFLSWCPAVLCDLSLTHLSAGMGLKSESHKRNLSNLLCQLVDVWAGSPSRMVKFGGAPLA